MQCNEIPHCLLCTQPTNTNTTAVRNERYWKEEWDHGHYHAMLYTAKTDAQKDTDHGRFGEQTVDWMNEYNTTTSIPIPIQSRCVFWCLDPYHPSGASNQSGTSGGTE
mmetsp:Transcript_4485/g.10901  ORF Transcript_4485/g.10901 Transcript_4485/m.10901 type:complete len:108 (-) Transcript_4485:2952-3275(-)